MKKQIKHLKLYLPLLIVLITFSGIAQGNITHIALKENRSGNGDCTMLDIPQILGNPKALLFITQKESDLNPHPIGAFYFKNRWNIMNLDQAGMPDYARFNVEYFINPDYDHFQYVIKREDIRKDGSAIINHPALNDHPDTQFSIFHTWVPESKEYGNREETMVQYFYAGINRWVLKNVNNKALVANVAYNIAVSSHGKAVSNPITTNLVTTPVNNTGVNTTSTTSTTVTTTPVTTTPVNNNPTNNIPTNNKSGGLVSGPIQEIFMTAWVGGTKLPGDNIRASHADQTAILGYDLGILIAREAGTGQATGRRSHEPVIIKYAMGYPVTAPILETLIKSQSLTILLDFYTHDQATGGAVINYSVKLSNVLVAGFKEIYEEDSHLNTVPGSHKRSYNEIKFTYKKLEFISASGGIVEINN